VTIPEGAGPDFNSAPPVPPITHDSGQVEHVMRTPIEAPGLWKSAGIAIMIAAVFFGLSLWASTSGTHAPNPSAYTETTAAALFVLGAAIYLFTRHVERDARRLNTTQSEMLAKKIRAADTRTALPDEDN
jgi:hypothetical protein